MKVKVSETTVRLELGDINITWRAEELETVDADGGHGLGVIPRGVGGDPDHDLVDLFDDCPRPRPEVRELPDLIFLRNRREQPDFLSEFEVLGLLVIAPTAPLNGSANLLASVRVSCSNACLKLPDVVVMVSGLLLFFINWRGLEQVVQGCNGVSAKEDLVRSETRRFADGRVHRENSSRKKVFPTGMLILVEERAEDTLEVTVGPLHWVGFRVVGGCRCHAHAQGLCEVHEELARKLWSLIAVNRVR